MSKKLSPPIEAYNAIIIALNEKTEAAEQAIEERNRLWLAANAICPGIGHGRGCRGLLLLEEKHV